MYVRVELWRELGAIFTPFVVYVSIYLVRESDCCDGFELNCFNFKLEKAIIKFRDFFNEQIQFIESVNEIPTIACMYKFPSYMHFSCSNMCRYK